MEKVLTYYSANFDVLSYKKHGGRENITVF